MSAENSIGNGTGDEESIFPGARGPAVMEFNKRGGRSNRNATLPRILDRISPVPRIPRLPNWQLVFPCLKKHERDSGRRRRSTT